MVYGIGYLKFLNQKGYEIQDLKSKMTREKWVKNDVISGHNFSHGKNFEKRPRIVLS